MNHSPSSPSIGSRIGLSIFFLFFFGMGLLFAVLLGKSWWQDVCSITWPTAQSEILSSRVTDIGDDDNPYQFDVTYRYQWQGQTHTSQKVSAQPLRISDYSKAETLRKQYAAGSRHEVRVNPEDPQDSVLLSARQPWLILFLLLPALFILIGGGGIWVVWFRLSQTAKTRSRTKTEVAQKKQIGSCLVAFFLIVFASLLGYFLGWKPLWMSVQARSWVAMDCQIIASKVRSHDGDDTTTYSVDIIYEYLFDGQTYRSNQYAALGGSSSGYKKKLKIVSQYPSGSVQPCFVNPAKPQQALLSRDYPMISLVVSVVCGAMLLWGLWLLLPTSSRSKSRITQYQSQRQAADPIASLDGRFVLLPEYSPKMMFTGSLIFTLLWNGAIVFVAASQGQSMDAILKTVFGFPMVVFFLIGLCGVAGTIYLLLASWNPIPELDVDQEQIRLGEPFRLCWRFKGSIDRLVSVKMTLVGIEEATYSRGTRRITDRHTFYHATLMEMLGAGSPHGEVTTTIPLHTAPTWTGRHNRLVWKIKCKGSIDNWPDINLDYPVYVHPNKVNKDQSL